MLLIISDSHDNIVNLDKALAFAKANPVEAVLHCGDLTNSDTLDYLCQEWTKTLYLVQGNCEIYELAELRKYPQIINLGREGGIFKYQESCLPAGTVKIGACHEPKFIENLLIHEPAFVFYGHTHTPWEEQRAKTRVINPGNLDGSRYPATLATYESESKELKLVLLSNL